MVGYLIEVNLAVALTSNVCADSDNGPVVCAVTVTRNICKGETVSLRRQLQGTYSVVLPCQAIVKAAASGQLSPDVAAQLVNTLANLAHITEFDELRLRVEALEIAVRNK